ncbi:MAG: hypothetical protein JKX85_10450 [Phycisphaeraceae bacterium]|nr:hypothetical protein [Phycisphaeraceae bacterium]
MQQPQFITIGSLARDLSVEPHQINYVINKLGIIAKDRVGIIRMFSKTDAGQIREELQSRNKSG